MNNKCSKYITVLLIVVSILPILSFAQKANTKSASIYVGCGFLELFAVGFDYPVTDNLLCGFKLSSVINSGGTGGDVLSSRGVGVKAVYLLETQEIFFNSINIEATYLTHVGHEQRPRYGLGYEATIGSRKESTGFQFFWDAGFGVTYAPKIPTLYFPCVKIGYQYNI